MRVGILAAVVFWLLVLSSVGGAAMVAFSKNIVRSAFALLATFIGVAGLFLYLSADFVGIVQVLIYVGGVLVLFLFAVMLTGNLESVQISNPSHGIVPGILVAIGTLGVLGAVAIRTPFEVIDTPDTGPTTQTIGDALLTEYVLPFEIASILLVAALIGAVLLASHRGADGTPRPLPAVEPVPASGQSRATDQPVADSEGMRSTVAGSEGMRATVADSEGMSPPGNGATDRSGGEP